MADEFEDLLAQLEQSDGQQSVTDGSAQEPECESCIVEPASIATNIPQLVEPEIEAPNSKVDVSRFFERYELMSSELFSACRADRQEAQDAIDLCRNEIIKVTGANGNPRDIPRMFVDGYIKAIEVKAGVNQTAVKMLDAGAKLIAAAKSHINVQQTNVNVHDNRLDQILTSPMGEDDQW